LPETPVVELASPTPDIQPLATLLYLARRARQAHDDAELAFIAVNETLSLAAYRQAALWLNEGGVKALSGVVSAETNAPYVQWLGRVFRHLQQPRSDPSARVLTASDLPAAVAAEWGEWLPAQGLWLPLPSIAGRFSGGALLLARDAEWSEAEFALLTEWAAIWSQARALMARPSLLGNAWRRLSGQTLTPSGLADSGWGVRLRRLLLHRRLWLSALLLGAMFIPVRLTVLAPAELIPLRPAVIRAPLDGVVDRVLVTPNQQVKEDDALFEFDRANIQNRLQVALRALATTQAEYRQKAQQALFDPVSKSQLAVLQSQIAEKNTEVSYLRKLDQRGVVASPRAGIVLFDDPTEWVGRPVVTGERVMVVADEHAVEVEAWLSPADAIPLRDDAPVTLYLNADPTQPLAARLRYISHEAIPRPDGNYAYRVRASLIGEASLPRVGLKGTAKLAGEEVSLGYWMLRRPLAAMRAWLGI